jgi:photosystem I P700 chlorophyll a apoprotein A2
MPLSGQPAHAFRVAFYTGDWALYSTTNQLTSLGGLKLDTYSLASGDIGHHHLSVGVIFLWAGHLCSSIYNSFAHRLADIYAQRKSSAHLKLSLALSGLSIVTSAVAADISSLTPYPYLSYDYVTVVALYLHHSAIASFLMVGSFAHAGILLVRDGGSFALSDRILDAKSPLISHLSWVSLWLGFHTTGLYVHNDTVSAFSEGEKQLLIEPVFSQIIGSSGLGASSCKALSYGATTLCSTSSSVPKACANLRLAYEMGAGPGDFMVAHAIALGLHLVTLILLKGCLDARGSRLMPDKVHMAWAFACDGPHRGGTCDISAWDSVYLATFWSLNTGAWIGFYFHWKHLALWQNSLFQFDESSSYLNAWFSNYLWFNSSPLIRAYDALHANDLSVWAWTFLAAHLCWATGFMFLISWRGYWQELIDICLYMHLKTPIGYSLLMLDIYTPVALSILQARALGLFHFGCGTILTYAAFIVGASS